MEEFFLFPMFSHEIELFSMTLAHSLFTYMDLLRTIGVSITPICDI
jgi:hypothetical protein